MTSDHVADGLLIRAMDDELPGSETAAVEAHLAKCDACRQRYQQLRSVSIRFESAIAGFVPRGAAGGREMLMRKMTEREEKARGGGPASRMRQFGWAMALAAMLAIALLFIPQRRSGTAIETEAAQVKVASSAFEVDGERFIALPYSNPELPMAAPHIVQMQVPVSSLAAAGIVFEPISNRVSSPDRSVLADVLLGIDGQPLGVHVVGAE